MTDSQAEEEAGRTWIWIAAVAGAAGAVAGVFYFLRYRDPGYRMDRLLRRCEARIDDVEGSLAKLEQSISESPS
ncbi:MAG: hypothetical protein JSV79_11460 [Armatimonadota bacterium]|nr:MAG: hypothetical protein JSV79_11460 [Armatimonadota bacterium]